MQTSALFGAKSIGFFKIYGVSVQTKEGGLSQCKHFANKGEGQFFAILCECPLWTDPLTVPTKAVKTGCFKCCLNTLRHRNRLENLITGNLDAVGNNSEYKSID